jgi:hypothetical protein
MESELNERRIEELVENAYASCRKRTYSPISSVLSQPGPRALELYVDGSYSVSPEGIVRIGAGVWFAPNDPDNLAMIVPHSNDPNCTSTILRAELYASLLALVLARSRKHASPKTVIRIHQDSVMAIALLNACHVDSCPELSTMSPSTWASQGAVTNEGTRKFHLRYRWGETVDAAAILEHSDILDLWWHYSKSNRIECVHVLAHQKEPKCKTSKSYKRWLGNAGADRLSKQGAAISRWDLVTLRPLANFPLVRQDSTLFLPPILSLKLS